MGLMEQAILAEATDIQIEPSSTEGIYDIKGNWIAGSSDPVTVKATVQPISGNDLKDAPEGVRSEINRCVWTTYLLQNDQRLVYEGETYRVLHIWERRGDNFTKAAIGKVKSR